MSRKMSRRLGRETAKQQRRERKRAGQQLRQQQRAQGLEAACLPRRAQRRQVERPALPNAKSAWATVGEEQAGRQQAVEEQACVFRSLLPTLLKRLAKIAAPRNPKALQHQLTVVLLYGILTFVFQMASRARGQSAPEPEEEICPLSDPALLSRGH